MTAVAQDILSEQLIAQLLDNDLLLLDSFKQAEKLQLDQVVAASARTQGRIPKYSKLDSASMVIDADVDLAFQLYLSDARVSNDASYAQAVQSQTYTVNTADHQYAQKLAANERHDSIRKVNLDAEFARRLQVMDDAGQADIDDVKDAECILGDNDTGIDLNAVPVANSGKTNAKGKGQEAGENASSFANIPYPTCGICLDSFISTHSPISAALSANSSNRLPFGLRLPCPKDHAYCISCFTSYIQNKLDPDGRGLGKSSAIVFPIRCPECILGEWPNGIEDEVAKRVLGEDGMVQWHHQKLLDSIPRLFCPNPKCSSLVEADGDSPDPQAICPSCRKVMCVPCRTHWHTDLTCEEYQALPLDERSPEDRLVLDLAKAEQWRRCPNCAVIVELVSGCNHMTCICGFHFCFKCGSPTTREGKCKSNPPCELWDEEMLLEQRERARNPVALPRAGLAIPLNPLGFQQPQRAPEPYRPPAHVPQPHHNDLAWMDDPHVLSAKHLFTHNMVHDLTCGYCNLRLNSLADLRYHLAHVRRHPVYACCGRFFNRRVDFERHEAARPARFGYHAHQMLHD
ncbi:hypothetical protein FPV67DRAFT_1626064 [Lyophyllum atratum]|nr:hypothetical protein FPV67DRAFT_1626064 [Lyophyllum atratum]